MKTELLDCVDAFLASLTKEEFANMLAAARSEEVKGPTIGEYFDFISNYHFNIK